MVPNNNKNNPSFLDPKTIFAIIAVAAIYFGWQTYIQKKYPEYGKKPVVETTTVAETKTEEKTPAPTGVLAPGETKTTTEVQALAEKALQFQSDRVSFVLSSQGMGVKNLTVNTYTDKEKNRIQLGVFDQNSLFALRWTKSQKAIDFDLKEESPGRFVGVATAGAMTITRELEYNAEKGFFANKITIKNPTEEVLNGISLIVPEKIHVAQSHSFLFPSYEHQDFIVRHSNKNETVNFSGAKEDIHKEFKTTSLVSLGSQYFATAALDKSEIMPDVILTAKIADHVANAELVYKPVQLSPEIVLNQTLYAGPKSIDILKAIDPEMTNIIDFGFFGFISKPLLYVMKAFHSFIPNWGLAIILLTLLVRLCVMPFNIMSFRSMKSMQKVQPVLQGLREKYKDDPITLQKQTMATMKEHGANPIGGCLPMLLQIPIFFALYRVIGSSIELYQSPFIFWITDLSSHDKFYVLPVLMGITMYLQQKLTPTTMDPAQAKIMAFLPLVFCLFMLQLPSGLTLYMFVSTLFGIIQQYLMMRDTKAEKKA